MKTEVTLTQYGVREVNVTIETSHDDNWLNVFSNDPGSHGPPLSFSEEDAEKFLAAFQAALVGWKAGRLAATICQDQLSKSNRGEER